MHRIRILLVCAGLTVFCLNFALSRQAVGSGESFTTTSITVETRQQRLAALLQEIDEKYNISIAIGLRYLDIPVTVSIAHEEVLVALSKILDAAGVANYAFSVQPASRTITVNIVGEPVISVTPTATPSQTLGQTKTQAQSPVGPDGSQTPPPESQIAPQDREILPPGKPGDKGVTLRDIEAARNKEHVEDPETREVLPPGKPGDNGVTLRDIEAARNQEHAEDSETREVLPPGTEENSRRITQKDIDTLRAAEPKGNPLDQEILPPATPGEKGVTLREIQKAAPPNSILNEGNAGNVGVPPLSPETKKNQ